MYAYVYIYIIYLFLPHSVAKQAQAAVQENEFTHMLASPAARTTATAQLRPSYPRRCKRPGLPNLPPYSFGRSAKFVKEACFPTCKLLQNSSSESGVLGMTSAGSSSTNSSMSCLRELARRNFASCRAALAALACFMRILPCLSLAFSLADFPPSCPAAILSTVKSSLTYGLKLGSEGGPLIPFFRMYPKFITTGLRERVSRRRQTHAVHRMPPRS